ncbi:MAG: autotransporter outer membrane beta-barrel domain-containing protein, partial [Saezia sp.]
NGTISGSAFVEVDTGAVFDIAPAATAQNIKNLGGGGTVTLGVNDLALTNAFGEFSGVIQGTGGFEVKSGIEVLSGVNTYTGVTKISSGSGVLALQGIGSIASSSEVQIAGGDFDISLTSAGASIQRLSGTGSVGLGSKTLTITNASGIYDGGIIGSGGLTIANGAQTLSAISIYTGVTQVDAGAQLNLAQAGEISYSSKVIADGTFDIAAATSGASVISLAGGGVVNLGAQTLTLTSAEDTFSGSISGTGGLTITGGTEVLSGVNSYNGKTTIRANLNNRTLGTLAVGNTNALSAASAYEVQIWGTLDLLGFGQTIASLENAGTVSLPASAPGLFTPTMLTVAGAYTSNGGMLKLGTNLLTGASDQLDVNSVALGSAPTGIVVTNKGIGGTETAGSGILLVKTATVADPRAFQLGAPVSAGAYDYKLYYGPNAGTTDPEGWYLRSILRTPPGILPDYRPEVPVDTVSPALANKMALAMLGTYHERSGAYGRTQNGRADGVWGRFFGESGDVSYSGSGIEGRFNSFMDHGATYSYDLGGMQIGSNLGSAIAADGSGHTWGGYFGIGRLDSDIDQVTGSKAGSNAFTAYTVGGYWSYEKEQGAYVEGVVQAMYLDRLKATTLRGQQLETKGMGMTVSLEGGYPFELGANWVLEPQAQLVYQYTSIKDENDDFGRIDFDASSALYARVGARIGNNVARSQSAGKWRYFARLNLWHSVKDNAHATVTDMTKNNPVKFNTSLGG